MAASATTTTSASSSSEIFSINPYENHPSLSQLEADVLWEYAKLNQHIKDVCLSSRVKPFQEYSKGRFFLSPLSCSWFLKHAL
jgi:hypothetical protein